MGEERPESFLLPRPIYPLPAARILYAGEGPGWGPAPMIPVCVWEGIGGKGKGYRMALPRDYRNRAILYPFPTISRHRLTRTHARTYPRLPSRPVTLGRLPFMQACIGVGSACVMWVCMDGGRYIGWPYFYNLLVGPSYIPSPRPQPIDIDGWGMGKTGLYSD